MDGVGLTTGERTQFEAGLEAESFEAGRQALERRRLMPVFDPTYRRRGDARANGQLLLRDPGAMTGIAKHLTKPRSGGLHNGYVISLAARWGLEPELTDLLLASL
jgi:hypothetical protein